MLRRHDLDDKRFAEIVEKARFAAPEYFSGWNDYNTHDPGVTLTELFAWLTEQQRFYLNQSESAEMYLPLLGVTVNSASAATVEIIVHSGGETRVIPAGTPLFAEQVRFETTADVVCGGDVKITVTQRETITAPVVIGYADGSPDANFYADTRGHIILREGFALTVNGEAWTLTGSFHKSKPYDKHFTLNSETGEITFGDGFRGALPVGEVVVETMAITRGPGGNIAPERIKTLDGISVSQPDAAYGGENRETVTDALRRALNSRRQAVTAQDIEQLIRETPGVRVERVKVFADGGIPEQGAPRIITAAVKLSDGALTADVKNRIYAHLEPYRLVCRVYNIVEPDIVRVALTLDVRTEALGAGFRAEFESSLRAFFADNYGGFGERIRVSEIRAFAMSKPEVREVTYCTLRTYGGIAAGAQGDITPQSGTLFELGEIFLRITGSEY